jgi:hypothetical protein
MPESQTTEERILATATPPEPPRERNVPELAGPGLVTSTTRELDTYRSREKAPATRNTTLNR